MSRHRMVEDLEMECFLLQERAEKQQARIKELEESDLQEFAERLQRALCAAQARIEELEADLEILTLVRESGCECGDDEACKWAARIQELEAALEKREVMHMNALAIIPGLQAVVEAARSVVAVETVGDPNDEEQWDDLTEALARLDGEGT